MLTLPKKNWEEKLRLLLGGKKVADRREERETLTTTKRKKKKREGGRRFRTTAEREKGEPQCNTRGGIIGKREEAVPMEKALIQERSRKRSRGGPLNGGKKRKAIPPSETHSDWGEKGAEPVRPEKGGGGPKPWGGKRETART